MNLEDLDYYYYNLEKAKKKIFENNIEMTLIEFYKSIENGKF